MKYRGIEYKDGYYTIQGIEIYYKLFKSPHEKKKLICLHGGPGITHDLDLPIAELSRRGITVLFYDQCGCGKSGEPKDISSILTMDYHVDEVEAMRKVAFGSEKVYFIGHSWGGMLGLAYAARYPQSVRALTSTGGLSSFPYYMKEVTRLIRRLPLEIRRTITKYQARGDYNNPGYLRAVDYFYHKHFCRLDKWPTELYTSLDSVEKRKVYKTWWGPNEFTAIGPLQYLDITNQLHLISAPTLITTGTYDEITPNVARMIQKNVNTSTLVNFAYTSHCPMWEIPKLYLDTVENFINRN